MKKEQATPPNDELRRQAEAKLSDHKKKTLEVPETNADIQRLVHELQVHQIELEMQNNELLQARMQLEATLSMYVELYAFAPVGYFTLTHDGTIRHANLTGAKLMGVRLNELTGRRLHIFIAPESRLIFDNFLHKVFASQNKEICEVALDSEGPAFWVNIIGVSTPADDQSGLCYVIVSEVTKRKRSKA